MEWSRSLQFSPEFCYRSMRHLYGMSYFIVIALMFHVPAFAERGTIFINTGDGSFGCDFPLLKDANLSASSSLSAGRGPEAARFEVLGQNAWSPAKSDFNQFLFIEFHEPKRISAVATMGRSHTLEFVQNFTLEFGDKPNELVAFSETLNIPKVIHIYRCVGWAAQFQNADQWLQIDLGKIKIVKSIATWASKVDGSYVSFFRVLFGDEIDGQFMPVRSGALTEKVFEGNHDGSTVHRNELAEPIVARYVRINPRHWNQIISFRLELFGCDYDNDIASFDGDSFIRIDLSINPITAAQDHLRFRFRTAHPDGLIVYSEGVQGDLLIIQLTRGQLFVTVSLGVGKSTTLKSGTALDDGLWHAVQLTRDERRIQFWVDGASVIVTLEGGFYKMNLEKVLYVGGTNSLRRPGITSSSNFIGCLENIRFNHTNIIWQLRNLNPVGFERIRNVNYFCPDVHLFPISLENMEASLTISTQEQDFINASFHFRTYDTRGMLLFKEMVEDGFVKVYIDREHIKLKLKARGIPDDTVSAFSGIPISDGSWHRYSLVVRTNTITQTLDNLTSLTKRVISVKTKRDYVFGARSSPQLEAGIRGCLRAVFLDGIKVELEQFTKAQQKHVILQECRLRDRCSPNPCHNGGICRQNYDEFECDCSSTGYAGAVCKTSLNPLTCEEYRLFNPRSTEALIQIDLDGSGKLESFPVLCKFLADGRTESHVEHSSMQEAIVDGFQSPGSYSQHIRYNATWSQLAAFVNQSQTCRQYIRYSCRNAKLLNTPQGPAYGTWNSRSNLVMTNWGGVSPGLFMCACGLTESCFQKNKYCNCDADDDPMRNQMLVDEGWLSPKDYLPVRQLAFGDTGSFTDFKESRYQLGPLICEGSQILNNAVTFWRPDATLAFPFFQWSEDGDIYFQFRCTVESGTFIHWKSIDKEFKISLLSPTEIQLFFHTGQGQKSVSVHTTRQLNDDTWHSVLTEVNRQEARIRVDGSLSSEVRNNPDESHGIDSVVHLIIGANVDLSGGFVGCLRALMIGGRLLDMMNLANRGVYGIKPGCVGKCTSSPCLNGGSCKERYDSYICDCRFTAFRGPICADEIGANFRADDYVVYDFSNNMISTIGETVRIGFVTTEPSGILMQVVTANNEYLSVELANNGFVRVAFDLGFERQEVYEESEYYANGQFHDVRVWRSDGGRTLNMKVDEYDVVSKTYRIGNKQDAQLSNIKSIFIGRNSSMQGRPGFVGCISRAAFEDFFILKLLFQQNPPENVKSNRRLREDWCDLQPVTHLPEIIPERPNSPFPYGIIPTLLREGHSDLTNQTIMGVVLALVIGGLLVIGILIARCFSRGKGVYQTHEADDNGGDAVTLPLTSTAVEAPVSEEFYL